METLKVLHENCGGDLTHQFSTLHHDFFECSKCKELVKSDKNIEAEEPGQLLFMQ